MIKDILTRQTLHQGSSNGRYYQLPLSLSVSPVVNIATFDTWHARLEHANSKIVTEVLNNNLLSFNKGSSFSFNVCKLVNQISYHSLPLIHMLQNFYNLFVRICGAHLLYLRWMDILIISFFFIITLNTVGFIFCVKI